MFKKSEMVNPFGGLIDDDREAIYISGPVIGSYNRDDFSKAKEYCLKNLSPVVINPVEVCSILPNVFYKEAYTNLCLLLEKLCNAIYFLLGWRGNHDCRAEYEYAKAHHYHYYFQVVTDPHGVPSNTPSKLCKECRHYYKDTYIHCAKAAYLPLLSCAGYEEREKRDGYKERGRNCNKRNYKSF